jgi:predicted Zn-dependent peptidase
MNKKRGKKEIYNLTRLDNGLRIISEKIPHFRSISLGFWFGKGSRDESKNEKGITHLIEHLLFKGTPTRDANKIAREFDEIGAEFNAFTSKEYICLYSKFLDQHFTKVMTILSDVIMNSNFLKKDVNLEKNVVLEEIKSRNDTPSSIIIDLFNNSLFGKHPLSSPVLGLQSTVKSLTRDQIFNFYKDSISNNNIVIASVGNIEHESLLNQIRNYLKIPTIFTQERKKFSVKPRKKIDVIKKDIEQTHICYGTLGVNRDDEDRFALSILLNILGGSMSSRLFQEVREKRGLVYSIFGYHLTFMDTGSIIIYAGTSTKNVENIIKIIKKEINGIKKGKIDKDELERSKNNIKGHLVLGLEETNTRMVRIGESILCRNKVLSINEVLKKIDDVTLNDVIRVTNKLFREDLMVLAAVGPITYKQLEKAYFA